MMSPQMTRLDEHLQRLRLSAVRERLEALLQEAAAQELSYADFLDRLLSEEVEAKTAKHVTMRTSLARFPFIKGLDSFEFGYQPSVDRKQVQKLSLCHFVEHGENVVLLGPPGVGKTHLAVGLGRKAIEHGYRVLFTTAAAMLTTLTKALSEGRLDDKLKVYTIPRLLIIDEIGYLPIVPPGGHAVFSAHQPALRARELGRHDQSAVRPLVRGVPGCDRRRGRHRPHRAPCHRADDQRGQLPPQGRPTEPDGPRSTEENALMGTRRDVASRRSVPSGHVATTTLQRGPFSRCHKVPFLLAISTCRSADSGRVSCGKMQSTGTASHVSIRLMRNRYENLLMVVGRLSPFTTLLQPNSISVPPR